MSLFGLFEDDDPNEKYVDDQTANLDASNNPMVSTASGALCTAFDGMLDALDTAVRAKADSITYLDKQLKKLEDKCNKLIKKLNEILESFNDAQAIAGSSFSVPYAKEARDILIQYPILRRYIGEANYWFLFDTVALLDSQGGQLASDILGNVKSATKAAIKALLDMTQGLMHFESYFALIAQVQGALYMKFIPNISPIDSICPNVTCAYYYKPATNGPYPTYSGFRPVPLPIFDYYNYGYSDFAKYRQTDPDTYDIAGLTNATEMRQAFNYWTSSYRNDANLPNVPIIFGTRKKYIDKNGKEGPHPLQVFKTFTQLDSDYCVGPNVFLGAGEKREKLLGSFVDSITDLTSTIQSLQATREDYFIPDTPDEVSYGKRMDSYRTATNASGTKTYSAYNSAWWNLFKDVTGYKDPSGDAPSRVSAYIGYLEKWYNFAAKDCCGFGAGDTDSLTAFGDLVLRYDSKEKATSAQGTYLSKVKNKLTSYYTGVDTNNDVLKGQGYSFEDFLEDGSLERVTLPTSTPPTIIAYIPGKGPEDFAYALTNSGVRKSTYSACKDFVSYYKAMAAESLDIEDTVGYSIDHGREIRFPVFGIYGELDCMATWDFKVMKAEDFITKYAKIGHTRDLYLERKNPKHVVMKGPKGTVGTILYIFYHEHLNLNTKVKRGPEEYDFFVFPGSMCSMYSTSAEPFDFSKGLKNAPNFSDLQTPDYVYENTNYFYDVMANVIPSAPKWVNAKYWSIADIIYELYSLVDAVTELCGDGGKRRDRLNDLLNQLGVFINSNSPYGGFISQLPDGNGISATFTFAIFNDYASRLKKLIDTIYGVRTKIYAAMDNW